MALMKLAAFAICFLGVRGRPTLSTTRLNSLLGQMLVGSHSDNSAIPFSPGFAVSPVIDQAQSLPSHSWEFGTASEALLELYNSSLSVYGDEPFALYTEKGHKLDLSSVPSLVYAHQNIVLGTGNDILSNGTGAAGDPASLGVSAILLGHQNDTYRKAADAEAQYLLEKVPRFWNGAISHRADYPELWADFMYMAPPFLAYYGAYTNNITILNLTVEQCTLYRQVLKANLSDDTPWNGVWEHIIGPMNQDTGLWSTGNAWAAAGMMRVLATVRKAPLTSTYPKMSSHQVETWRKQSSAILTSYILEILDGILGAPLDNGLVRNYIDDETNEDGLGYGETSGTALLASVAYRIAPHLPEYSRHKYIKWADAVRKTFSSHVSLDGIVSPAVNPLNWKDIVPYTSGSPEGENFVVLMYAAWRDCVRGGVCEL